MGFFKMFYFLKRILYKIPKKVLVYVLIFIILMLFTTSSHASQVDVTNLPNYDVVEGYRQQMNSNWYRFVYDSIVYARQHNNTFNSNVVSTFYNITHKATAYRFGIYDANYYNLYFLNNGGTRFAYQDTRLCLAVALSFNNTDTGSIIIPTALNSGSGEVYTTVYQPASCLMYQTNNNNYVYQDNCKIEIIDVFDNYIPDDLFDIIYNIGQNSFDFSISSSVLDEISQKIDETNQQLEDMNNFFNSDTTPTVTNNDLPSDNMNDVTREQFNGIFTRLFDATNTTDVEEISIPIPYLNYSFTVRSNYLENIIRSWSVELPNAIDGSILTLIYIIWRFIIYRYIVLDIYKYINDFKNGNISKTDTNIKADML